MTFRMTSALSGILLLVSSGAWAATDPAPAASPQPASAPATAVAPAVVDAAKQDYDNQIVCVTEDPPTGSHLGGGRVCKKRGEWDTERRQARESLERVQTMGNQVNRAGGN
jgi:hypothetical protein